METAITASASAMAAAFGVWAMSPAGIVTTFSVFIFGRYSWSVTDRISSWVTYRRHLRRVRASVKVESRPESWTAQDPPARVPAPSAESLSESRPESRGREPGRAVSDAPESAEISEAICESTHHRPVLFVGAKDQLIEFIADRRARFLGKHPSTGRWEERRSDKDWTAVYRSWAQQRGIVCLPSDTFLKLLSKDDGVLKSRDRLRDPTTGRIMKTPGGTDLRGTFYTVLEEPMEDAAPVRQRRNPQARRRAEEAAAAAAGRREQMEELDRTPLGTWAEEIEKIRREELSKVAA